MNPENIVIDKKTIKALNVKSRLHILELIQEKPKTLSMLAEELQLKASTISEHLKELEIADLIRKEKTERKWKYYYTTKKSEKILSPYETKVIFTLFSSLFLSLLSIVMLLKNKISTASTTITKRTLDATIEAVSIVNKTPKETNNLWSIILIINIIIIIVIISYTMLKIKFIKKLENK